MVHSEIEAIKVFGGTDYLNVMEFARHRNLQTARFENLLMEEEEISEYHRKYKWVSYAFSEEYVQVLIFYAR